MKKRRRIKVGDIVTVEVGPLAPAGDRLAADGALVASRANDTQVGGGHYKARAIEPWDVVAVLGLDPFQADILYYVLRWKDKGGLEDLEKAQHWLAKYLEVERLRKELGDHGMRARLLEAAFTKAQARAAEVDRDASLYFGHVDGLQRGALARSLRGLRNTVDKELHRAVRDGAEKATKRRRAKR